MHYFRMKSTRFSSAAKSLLILVDCIAFWSCFQNLIRFLLGWFLLRPFYEVPRLRFSFDVASLAVTRGGRVRGFFFASSTSIGLIEVRMKPVAW